MEGVVRTEGLEPTCREALDPKSSASANFATSAKKMTLSFNLHKAKCQIF